MQGEAPATSAALFDDAELDTMFGMFDRIQRGTISEQQLRTGVWCMCVRVRIKCPTTTTMPNLSHSFFHFISFHSC
jgi:hypothetical protein